MRIEKRLKGVNRNMEMNFKDKSCREFTEVLSGSDPVPGGGGASALAGAVGTALSRMVGSLTLGKKKYKDVEPEIRKAMDEAESLQNELLELIERDAEVFSPLAAAYKLPKETEEEIAHKNEVMEKCLLDACMVPLDIMSCCCQAIELAQFFAENGSRMAVSDAGASAAILRGALEAASMNVYINTKSMKNREKAEELEERCDRMRRDYGGQAYSIVQDVIEALKH